MRTPIPADRCEVCHRLLTTDVSRALGVGPVCRRRRCPGPEPLLPVLSSPAAVVDGQMALLEVTG